MMNAVEAESRMYRGVYLGFPRMKAAELTDKSIESFADTLGAYKQEQKQYKDSAHLASMDPKLEELQTKQSKLRLIDEFKAVLSARADLVKSFNKNQVEPKTMLAQLAAYEDQIDDLKMAAKLLEPTQKSTQDLTRLDKLFILEIGLMMPELAHLADSLQHNWKLYNNKSSDEKTINAAIELIRDPTSEKKQAAYLDSMPQ